MRLSWKPATGLYRDLFMQSLQLRRTHAAAAGITWKRARKNIWINMELIFGTLVLLIGHQKLELASRNL